MALYNTKDNNEFSRKVLEILGERKQGIGYGFAQYNYREGNYIDEVLYKANSTRGIEIASTLRVLLPAYDGEEILCHDMINPLQIAKDLFCESGKKQWSFSDKKTEKRMTLIQDDTFLVVIEKVKKSVHIYMYRK